MKPTQALQNDVQVLELVIVQYVEALIPVSQLDAALPEDRLVLLCAHTLAHASMIQLFRRFAVDDGLSYEKCLRAARACINIIGHLSQQPAPELQERIVEIRQNLYYMLITGSLDWINLT